MSRCLPPGARPMPVSALGADRIAVLALPFLSRGLADLAGAEAVPGTGHVLHLAPGALLPAHLTLRPTRQNPAAGGMARRLRRLHQFDRLRRRTVV